MPDQSPTSKDHLQADREKGQREAALGRRFKAAQDGTLGPVLKRWINVSVTPVALRLKEASEAYLQKDYTRFATLLDTPAFGLAEAYSGGSPGEYGLEVLLQWFTKETTTGDHLGVDLTLAALGTVISGLATHSLTFTGKNDKTSLPGLTSMLGQMAEASRETAMGQFLTQIQGAEAMLRIRRKDRSSWAQMDKLNAIATMMQAQVQPQLVSEERGEVSLEKVGHRKILKVVQKGGQERRLSLRPPEANDWKLLQIARHTKGERDFNKGLWITFAVMVLCAAQAEHGWFEFGREKVQARRTTKQHRQRQVLRLSDEAVGLLAKDMDKWITLGFANRPMIIEPPQGDYLTVKHKPVTGRNGPKGMRTNAAGTESWRIASECIASTPWQVNREVLHALKEEENPLREIAERDTPKADLDMTLAAYSKEASEEKIYLPIYMDFRGRVYPRTTWVNYQGTDLQKSLLRFYANSRQEGTGQTSPGYNSLVRHMSNLYGNGMEKKTMPARRVWWEANRDWSLAAFEVAEEPLQTAAAYEALANYRAAEIPLQIDGTCNGLQHLTALFSDHTAAPYVNLTPSSAETDTPADIYGKVAELVKKRMAPLGHSWVWRIQACGDVINRKLCKKPVMVLPYGGTFDAVERAVKEAVLKLIDPDKEFLWQQALTMTLADVPPDRRWYINPEETSYLAFADRPLEDHPLFVNDIRELAKVVWACIAEVIPRAMAAMDAFRGIAKWVGERSLEWSNGIQGVGQYQNPLWIIHAYPKSARSTVKTQGFHLPNAIRGLQIRKGSDEIDPNAHRTGIVANFIHSCDAAHMLRTAKRFKAQHPEAPFAAIHDCYMTSLPYMPALEAATRDAFASMYGVEHPLNHPVWVTDPKTGMVTRFDNWWCLAKAAGVSFPDPGQYNPLDVRKSAWFFS